MVGWRPWWPKPRPKPHDTAAEFNPVLLIPGIGGSILNAISNDGKKKERIWVRLYNADQEFRTKLWSKYNPETGKTESLDRESHIEVPDDNHGLYSCDILDPDVSVPVDVVCYYHHMVVEMRQWGFKDGESLFGFGYDFRQSNRLPETLERLRARLEAIVAATGRRVDVVTHSMGGLLFKSLAALHPADVKRLVRKWVAIAAPFRGAPGFIMDTLLTGVEFLKGWQKSLFISKWTMHQLMVECPSVYELMADYDFHWGGNKPELRVVRRRPGDNKVQGAQEGRDGGGAACGGGDAEGGGESESESGSESGSSSDSASSSGEASSVADTLSLSGGGSPERAAGEGAKETLLGGGVKEGLLGEGVVEQRFTHLPDILDAMDRALQDNKIEVNGRTVPLPFNRDIVRWADETRRIWAKARLPPSVDFYTIYGTGLDTPFHSQYGSPKDPLNDLPDILHSDATFDCVHGDGTVPIESALADGFPARFRVGVPGAEHRELLRLPRVFSLLHFFLEVKGKDPLYDPLSDFVIVPRPPKGVLEGGGEEEEEEEDECQVGLMQGKRGGDAEEGRGVGDEKGGCTVGVRVEVAGQAVQAVVCESEAGKGTVRVSLTSISPSPDRAEV
ncbi:hypothetical protein CLOM_g14718 [Closterium sp. NIES-68]|nr:hypothetical protein CLOM_g14718 [Closterium sp. NIES-68]GJP75090.1 hypothetical protein CLOP_g5582 [Closterium sp. NIES-67]GJP81767.1 hypothetical protein CLOP_g11897 [Closterium sp. NIES-67]